MTEKRSIAAFEKRIAALEEENNRLQSSERNYRRMIDNLPDVVFTLDHLRRIRMINWPETGLYGYAKDEIVGGDFYSVVHPEDHEHVLASFSEADRERRRQIIGLRFRIMGKDGEAYWVELNAHHHFDEKGNYRGDDGVLRNIDVRVVTEQKILEIRNALEHLVAERTLALKKVNDQLRKENEDRKRIEKELRESEKRFRELADFLPQPIYEIGANRQLKYLSNVGYELAGYSKSEIRKLKNLSDLFHPDDRERFNRNLDIVFSGDKAPAKEYTMLAKNGACIPLILHSSPIIKGKKVVGLRGIVVDLRSRKKEEKQLFQYEKMAALGSMVAGVAHEINTPLGIGITASTFLEDTTRKYQRKIEDRSFSQADMEKFVTTVSEASSLIFLNLKRAADQVNSFKTVAVDQSSGEYRSFMLKRYINDVLMSLRPKYKRSGHIISVNCPENLSLFSSPGALSQIITNLVIYSLDHGFSSGEAGEITIDIRDDGDGVCLRYADNGKGMKPETLARIFEPFYTTSKKNGGTGLGMHIVHNIVTQSLKGSIVCHSREDVGTEFLISIPYPEHTSADLTNLVQH